MKNNKISIILILTIIIISQVGCSSKSTEVELPDFVNIPDWVFEPKIENGIAAAQCVKFSGNLSLDQQEITAKGRSSLAQQVNVRAQVMDKTYQNRVDTGDKVVSGSVFENVSKQITDQVLVGSSLIRTEFGTINTDQYICGLVGIDPNHTDKIFETIVAESQVPTISARDEDILYQEFKSYKAQQELSEALGNSSVLN